MIPPYRFKYLSAGCRLVLIDLPVTQLFGDKTLAEAIIQRVSLLCKTEDEFKFCIDNICRMIKESKGKEVQIFDTKYKKVLTKQDLKDNGLYLTRPLTKKEQGK